MLLKVNQTYHAVNRLISLRPSRMEAKGVSVTVLRKAVALLRQGTAKVRGDEQKYSQACMSGTSLQHKAKSSIHYKLCPYTRRPRIERYMFTPGGLPYAF